MFDLFLTCDFRRTGREKGMQLKFSKLASYKDIHFKEYYLNFPNGYVAYLERNQTDTNYIRKHSLHLFTYGSIFSNKQYQRIKNDSPHKVDPQELSALYNEYGEGIDQYIKGSFVLVIVDDKKGCVKVITDRLNVLPLYYCYKEQMLVLSSSVRMIRNTGFASSALDPQALTEQLLFNYMLRDHYFYKEIRQTENARIYRFSKEGLINKQYWSVEELYHEKLLTHKASLEMLSEQLFENVNLYASDRQKVLVSFTGGFDGRTNVAMIRKPVANWLCYSYGMPGSKQITVPQDISKKLNIQYRPIYLNEKFEQQYEQCAEEVIEFSNGTAPVIRANYPFAYKQLREYSDLIITGLFGSEILKPFCNQSVQTNQHSESIFISTDYKQAIRESINQALKRNHINPDLITNSLDAVIKSFKSDYFDKYDNYDKETQFMFFIIQEGIRKYFMQEIQIERVYVTTRFPYLDDDFIELIYRTPFAGLYNGFWGGDKVKRRKGPLLYAQIIKKFKPELGKFILDRGYSPNDLLKLFPFNYLFLIKGVLKTKRYKKTHGNDTFNSEKWTKQIFSELLNNKQLPKYLSNGLIASFSNETYLKDIRSFSHLISFWKYFET